MSTQENYSAPFPSNLRALISKKGTTITALARELGISRQAVSQYTDGTGQPNVNKLKQIAGYFGVSADYLLGITNDPAPRPSAVDDLGLSPEAVSRLRSLHSIYGIMPLLSRLLESRTFFDILISCATYVRLRNQIKEAIVPDLAISDCYKRHLALVTSDDYKRCEAWLKPHGLIISTPGVEADALFHEQIAKRFREALDKIAEDIEKEAGESGQH